jgi:uncharacterized protein (TIGR02246 family)
MRVEIAEQIDDAFAKALNAGDLDGLMQLYEADASLMPSPGHVARGTEAIRAALAQFISAKPRISVKAKALAHSGDVALVSAEWQLEVDAPEGERVTMSGRSVEVVRRQADGSWRFAIDFPFGVAP